MKNYLLEIILISIGCIFLLSFFIYMIVKRLRLTADKKLMIAKYKQVKKVVRKYKLKSQACTLHVVDNLLSGNAQLDRLKKDREMVELTNNIIIAASSNGLLLIVDKVEIKNIQMLKSTLGLKFEFLNVHFDISEHSQADSSFIEDIYTSLPSKDTKDLVVNFYVNEGVAIEEFNEIVGAQNIFKLSKEVNLDVIYDNVMTLKIINSDLSAQQSYRCIRNLNKISLLIQQIIVNNSDKTGDIYVYSLLNDEHSFYSRDAGSKYYGLMSPRNIIVNLLAFSLSTLFIVNIVSEFKLKRDITLAHYKKVLDLDSLNQAMKQQKNRVNENILLSSIYPETIKYHIIYTEYADLIAKNILLPSFTAAHKMHELFSTTVYLIYFVYMDNNEINSDTQKVMSVLAGMTGLSSEQLTYIIDYASPEVKQGIMEVANNVAKRLYESKDSKLNYEQEFGHILSLEGFNKRYFEISDDKRAGVVNSIYRVYLNKCLIDSVLPKVLNHYVVSGSIDNVLNLYREEFEKSSGNICGSPAMKAITDDIAVAINYTEKNRDRATNFKQVLTRITEGLDKLKSNDEPFKSHTEQEVSDNVTKILIQHIVNNIINNSYKSKELPLVSPVNDGLMMTFQPNFYDKKLVISPQYSEEYIRDNIDPLEQKYQGLSRKLNTEYGVNLSFLDVLYSNAISNYTDKYIASYQNLIKQLNVQPDFLRKISNEDTFTFYLISMSADNSQFNSLINFYKDNITFKDSDDFAKIKNHFAIESKFLNSKGYSQYHQIFAKLNDLIKEEGYVDTYQEIKSGYKPLKDVYKKIAVLNTNTDNDLYVLLKKHLDNAQLAIQTIAINRVMGDLDSGVESEYSYINNYLPMNLNYSKVLPNDRLISDIGNTGKIFTVFNSRLKPLLEYDTVDDKWDNSSFTSSQEKSYIAQFNKVYSLNKLLWDKDNKPKPITFNITPLKSEGEDYKFASIFFDTKSYVNSLNINYINPVKISYNWSAKGPVSIIVALKNGDTAERSYSGAWSILKALRDAECVNDVCTWTLSYKDKKYKVKFKVESTLLDAIKK
ncbi:hypothetical protein FLM55_05440 [Francisella sp. Scap27]|uniref:hypothetical protein n=1 Tax=Francisella sp. Scap27 TaxID=2589986 RepID=UPI0015BC680B|nr:hypothetical protein [Francisella sp. Scap27]QLE79213.1 hypothetical protein FLM55_05440 [Francisella sp. Scap27]